MILFNIWKISKGDRAD